MHRETIICQTYSINNSADIRKENNYLTLNLGCILIIIGIWIEKGMGLIIPGFIPAPLGEIWEYTPTTIEILVSIGIWSIGLLLLTAILKIVLSIETGEFKKNGLAHVPIQAGGRI